MYVLVIILEDLPRFPQPGITLRTRISQLQNQAEGGRGNRSGGVERLKTCSRRQETERQPGDWRAETGEEHEEGRKEWWVWGRAHRKEESRTRNGKGRQAAAAAALKAMKGEREQWEQKLQPRWDLRVQIRML